jgi:hypothetical protein
MRGDVFQQYALARRRGVPLVAVITPDAGASQEYIRSKSGADTPLVGWDVCRGWRPLNEAGKRAIAKAMQALGNADPEQVTPPPTQMLMEAAPFLPGASADGLVPGAVLFMQNVHRYVQDDTAAGAAFLQAVWNLRDKFKADARTLVLMAPALTLPPELQNDVLVIDEPLPSDELLGEIVCAVLEAESIPCAPDLKAKAVDALRGLSAFSAEQATALAVTQKRLDPDLLWARKEQMISAVPGLSLHKSGDTLDAVGGCEQIKRTIALKFGGKRPPLGILFIDEGEKMFAGAGSSTAPTKSDQLGSFLTKTQEWNDAGGGGMLFAGPPGAAKSMVGLCIGATYGVPTMKLDLGAVQNSLVGESERRLRQVYKVVDAVTGGRVLVIMTCNKLVDLPPELKRRFKGGTIYFDLPDADEQEVIWQKYETKFEITGQKRPSYTGWTGAEIRTACELQWEMGVPLAETPDFIVPVFQSAAAEIKALRAQADGRWLSASYPGKYVLKAEAEVEAPARRRMAGTV